MLGSVRGTVVRAENEYPIAGLMISGRHSGATARLWPGSSRISTRSDPSGSFAFDNLSQGEWIFTSEGSTGEVLGKATVHVFDDALSDVMIAVRGLPAEAPVPDIYREAKKDLAAPPRSSPTPVPGSVHGRVVQDNGQAFVGATITVVSGEGREPDMLPVSDVDGSFVLDGLPEGEWLLRALGPNGETGTAICHVFDNALSETTIELGPATRTSRRRTGGRPSSTSEQGMRGNVRGRVVRVKDGRPIPDATITVVSGAGPAPDIAPLSNQSGLFSLDGLPVGRGAFRAIAPDGQSGEAAVTVTADAVANVTIQVRSGG